MITALSMFVACSDAPPPQEANGHLDAVGHLVRASLAVRGIRPSFEEIEAVRADPAALDGLVDVWLQSDEFGATVRDMWAEILMIRDDTFNQLPALGALQGSTLEQIFRGTTEEPLKLIEYIVQNDRPFTEILTADYMLTDDITARIYGVPYDYEAGGWQMTAWHDDRPKAGILASAQVWRRWESNGSNFNRARAGMIARELLCEPFETRDILVVGGINIADEQAVANALIANDACVTCHQSLDPLAGYLWGYKKLIHRNYVADSINAGCDWDWDDIVPEFGPSYLPEDYCYPIEQYNPADEDDWAEWSLRTPSYYGQDVKDVRGVGEAIAEDGRFSLCMARQFYGYMTETEPLKVPFAVASKYQSLLENSGFNAKALVKAIVTDPEFARIAPAPGADGEPEESTARLFVIRPEQYARTVAELTGFVWMSDADPPTCANNSETPRFGSQCWGDVDLSNSDVYGFRSMAGGIDGKVVLEPIHTMTPTKSLVMSQLAANAAGFVVDNDFALPASERKLLGLVEATTTDEGKVRDQLVWLHERILAEFVEADSQRVTDMLALFNVGVAEQGVAAGGWRLVLTAMLQDPGMIFY